MESQRLEYVIKVTTATVLQGFTVSMFILGELLYRKGATLPQTPWILISSVICTLITHYYKIILPQYAAMVLNFHISHSDIAFVVKFKFSEGLSEI